MNYLPILIISASIFFIAYAVSTIAGMILNFRSFIFSKEVTLRGEEAERASANLTPQSAGFSEEEISFLNTVGPTLGALIGKSIKPVANEMDIDLYVENTSGIDDLVSKVPRARIKRENYKELADILSKDFENWSKEQEDKGEK